MSNRQFFWCLSALLFAAAVLFHAGRYTDLDLALADRFYGTAAAGFPARDNWFLERILHHAANALMVGIGMVPPLVLLSDRVLHYGLLPPSVRTGFCIVLATSIAVLLAISLLKYFSIQHCPWDLARYGGYAPYLRMFDALPAGASPGRCFPAGHASSALWLASGAAFCLPRRPARALGVFMVGLLPGLVLGLAQQARGAHFMTHTLWSIWITAFAVLLLSRLAVPFPARLAGRRDERAEAGAEPV